MHVELVHLLQLLNNIHPYVNKQSFHSSSDGHVGYFHFFRG